MKRKIFALVLAVALVMGMMVMPGAATEPETQPTAPVNLLENASFEDAEGGGWSYANYNSTRVDARDTEGDTAADGNFYLSLPINKSSIYLSFREMNAEETEYIIKPNRNYQLTFYARSSAGSAGWVDFRFRKNGKDYYDYMKSIDERSINGIGSFSTGFGINGYENEWFKVELDLNSPEVVDGFWLWIYDQRTDGDASLCVDNISLIETGKPSNPIKNGSFECFTNNNVLNGWNIGNPNYAKIIEEENGNHYFQGTASAPGAGGNTGYVYQNMYLLPGRYELSFRFKESVVTGTRPRMLLTLPDANEEIKSTMKWSGTDADRIISPQHREDTWETYKCWFEVLDNNSEPNFAGHKVQLRLSTAWAYNQYSLDDVVVKRADNSYIYYADAPSVMNSAETNAIDSKETHKASTYDLAWTKGNPVSSISECSDGVDVNAEKKAVNAIGYYVPKTKDAETFTVMTAVYEIDKTTKMRKLNTIQMADGTAVNGVPATADNDVYIDKLTGAETYTYELKSFIWDVATGMKPLTNAESLTY